MRVLISSTVAATLLSASIALAEPAPQYSADQFVRAMNAARVPCPLNTPAEACVELRKTKRWSLPSSHHASVPPVIATPPAVATVATTAAVTAPAKLPRVVSAADVLVTFATSSADISEQGKANLRMVAAGLLKDALAPLRFEVAGYTDISGTLEFNMDLSKRRAQAVADFLVSLNVPTSRLEAKGYGPEHLRNPDEPVSEANRRVEIFPLN